MNFDPSKNGQLTNDDELGQLLLELHYGLLDDDESTALKHRIETDPAVATQWAQTLVMAGKFAEAATVDASASKADLKDGGRTAETDVAADSSPTAFSGSIESTETYPPASTQPDPVDRVEPSQGTGKINEPQGSSGGSSRFLGRWLMTLATAASIAFMVTGVRYMSQRPARPAEPLQLAVRPVAGAETVSRNEFLIVLRPAAESLASAEIFDSSMPFVPATISFEVLSKGVVLFLGKAEATEDGPCRIHIPDEITVPEDAVLRLDAVPSNGSAESIRLQVPLEPTRCLTYLSTDRPVYRPGETVFFRSVTLNRRTFASHLEVPIRYELLDASGAAVPEAVMEGVTERGVGNGAFAIPELAPGGTYELVAHSLDGFFPDQTASIEVRQYRAVRLKTKLEFAKRSFSAGDRVEAELSVRRADDQIPIAANVRASAVVDGEVVHQETGQLNVNGVWEIAFDLPKVIRKGEGTLSIAIDDASVTETASRPIPIHTGRAEVNFYPEGGHLVGGIDNRVYFAARDTFGDPIEIEGEILSQSGRMVAEVKTVRDGMGRFEFKPESGQRYSLRITSPRDITETSWLPSVVEALPVIDTGTSVFEDGEPIELTIRSTKRQQCLVRAVCRGELVGVRSVELAPGDNPIDVEIQNRAAGVIRLTVLDMKSETARPLVERLVYRKGSKRLKIRATSDDGLPSHAPGDSVRMTVSVTDEHDDPVPGAVLGVSVVDDAALSLRQRELPNLKTHFLLASEIEKPEDLEHANFYLSDDPEAADSLDLLLGTQGWRRFVSGAGNPTEENFRDALTRLLELDGRRGNLVGQEQSNRSEIADRLRDYQMKIAVLWSQFLRELRWVLVVIGAIWLVAFLVRPRGRTVAAAGLLLLAAAGLMQAGCGARMESSVDSRALEETAGDEAFAASMQAPNADFVEAERDWMPSEGAEGALEDPAASQAKPPFVQRVVNAFFGDAGQKVPIEWSESKMTAQQLQRWANARGMDAQAVADQLMDELRFPIRQYAHMHKREEEGVRSDFAETLYWNPVMVTDSTGTATIRFELSDSLTLFRVRIDGHHSEGRLGTGQGSVATQLPLSVEPKVPLEVTAGDRIDLPVGIVNATAEDATLELTLETDDALKTEHATSLTSIAAGQRSSERFTMKVAPLKQTTEARIRVAASAVSSGSGPAAGVDAVERSIRIVPDGFPFDASQSGTLKKSQSVSLGLPPSVIPGTLRGEISLYPSPSSQLSAGLESILREPHGCFEQASASNYPNVMAIQLLELDGVADDRLQRRSASLLRRGYRKLTSYECSTLGYEWFGNDPGHEALSAFGLMQFSEMAKVVDVDPEMLKRTRDWLLGRRDGDGGFKRNPRHLHVWSVQQDVVNAYLLWALSQADLAAGNASRTRSELMPELERMARVAEASDDPYLIALSAATLGNVADQKGCDRLRDRLLKMQSESGLLQGKTTVTQSGGISLQVETTSLAILAWADTTTPRNGAHQQAARRAAQWLMDRRSGGGFGSTQATVLALKALIAVHDQMTSGDGGRVKMLVDGELVHTLRWQGRPADGVSWELPEEVLERIVSEDAQLVLRSGDDFGVPFSVNISGLTKQPRSDENCPIDLELSFEGADHRVSAASGDTVQLVATITNSTDQGRPMTVAALGLPGGLEPVIESLDQLKERGELDYYEIRGREVVLYWRTFAPEESRRLVIDCVAQISGRYTGPPSRAYLYYTAESKHWHPPLVAEIR